MGFGEMPRENIRPGVPGSFAVSVAWGRDLPSVEVAVTLDDRLDAGFGDGVNLLVQTVNGWLQAAGMPLVDEAKLRAAVPIAAWSGLHAHLEERQHVNDLIRTLRRARDAAFGRDE